ncbi:MAG: beta-lactamase family protein [Labilithrix sp.]|nr:beta-lactamase family protein [Labilithrix sp.]
MGPDRRDRQAAIDGADARHHGGRRTARRRPLRGARLRLARPPCRARADDAETLFDLASLTKPIATATSIMILVDRGQVDLDARASRYVPSSRVCRRSRSAALLHTSGLPAATPPPTGRPIAPRSSGASRPSRRAQPGERFSFSDVGFVVLQEIVQRVSGKELASFASEEVFAPLGMKDTGFLPSPEAPRPRGADRNAARRQPS